MTSRLDATRQSLGHHQSEWRLVNLALGIAALVGFVRGMGLLPFVPSQWLSPGLLTRGSLEELPRASVLVARLGVDYYLVVSLVLVVFLLTGVHGKLAAPRVKKATAALIATWVTYLALACVTAWIGAQSWPDGAAGATMLAIGLWLSPALIFVFVAGTAGAVKELRALSAQPAGTPCSARRLGAWILGPLLLSMLPVLLAPSRPLQRSMIENARFESLCREAGVELLARPAGLVRSIAFDWGPGYRAYSVPIYRQQVLLSPDGRIHSDGQRIDPMYEGDGHSAQFDFIESRMDQPGDAAKPYRRELRGDKAFYAVPSITADVVVMIEVDTSNGSSAKGYRLTLTDRRSGTVLGVYSYALDRTNRRACGPEAHHQIDPMAFINSAINP